MKNIKIIVLACGVAGLLSCFLGKPSLFQMREAPGFMVPVLLVVLGFAATAAMGAMAVAKPPAQRWQAIVALVGSIASLVLWQKIGMIGEIFKLTPLLKDHSLSSILFSVGFYGGLISSILWLAKGQDTAR
jgi:hypothetical protein